MYLVTRTQSSGPLFWEFEVGVFEPAKVRQKMKELNRAAGDPMPVGATLSLYDYQKRRWAGYERYR